MKNQLSSLIKIYHNALPDKLCNKFIQFFEENPKSHNLNGKKRYDYLQNSQWTELDLIKNLPHDDLQQFSEIMLEHKSQYEIDCGLSQLPDPKGFSDMRLKKYNPNGIDKFELHYDNYGPVSDRYLVFLWTLNNVEKGGETEFVDLDLSLKPERGRLVMFPPYWMFKHKANPPISNPKYIINTFAVW